MASTGKTQEQKLATENRSGEKRLNPKETRGAPVGKRDQILDAATRVFLQYGYEGTSMERVATESGAARRTLYNQFQSKEALFEAMIARVWASFPVFDITRDEESLSDPKIGLSRLGQAVSDFWAGPESVAFLRMVITEGPRFPTLTKTFFHKGKLPAMGAVADYLEALGKRKLVKVKNPALAARQFLGLIDEPLLWVRVIGSDEVHSRLEKRQVIENAVDMFLGFYEVKS
ncbi:TetR/AcrR family transcriptional regulator [Caballeronia sp. LjRoot34]|uniref:TetR/AcrR family transcriptional regulator n=1 Tax=Caballeronia sp. LjRoot34 TaxID=3342325 RepID=UPI003ECC5C85